MPLFPPVTIATFPSNRFIIAVPLAKLTNRQYLDKMETVSEYLRLSEAVSGYILFCADEAFTTCPTKAAYGCAT